MRFFSQHGVLKKSHVNMEHLFLMTACRRSRVDGSMRARLSVALLEIQRGASRAESRGVAHDPSTHDTRPGLRAGMAVAVNTTTWPAVAVEVLGHSFTPSLPAAISSRWAGKTEREARGRGRGAVAAKMAQRGGDIKKKHILYEFERWNSVRGFAIQYKACHSVRDVFFL
jgi:hypothetical protein